MASACGGTSSRLVKYSLVVSVWVAACHLNPAQKLFPRHFKMVIKNQTIEKFLEELSSKAPTPGGGAVAAVVGAMAAALVEMVASLSLSKDKEEKFREIGKKADKLRKELLSMADEDCQVFEKVMKAYRLPKESNKQQETRNKEIQETLKKAAETPLKTARKSVAVLKMASFCVQKGNQNAVSDARVGIELATAAVYSALENVRINLESIKDEKFCQKMKSEMEKILGCEDLKTG